MGSREIRKEGVEVQKRSKFPLLFICFAMFGYLFGCHRVQVWVGFCSGGRPVTRLKLVLVVVAVHKAFTKLIVLLLGDALAWHARVLTDLTSACQVRWLSRLLA